MKNLIIALSLVGMISASCNTGNSTNDKIDFTKSYESAALALTEAQNNYSAAVATNDPAKISAAKSALEIATSKFVSSKNAYVANGGALKPQYEQSLEKSTAILSTAATLKPGTIISHGVDSTVSNEANKRVQAVQSTIQNGQNKVVAKANKTVSDGKLKAQAAIKNTEDNLKKHKDEASKKVNDKVNDVKGKLGKLLE